MKKSTKIALIILAFLFAYLMYFQFFKKAEKISFNGETQGTYYAVTYYDKKSRMLQREIESLLKSFDMTASSWVNESIISRINRNDSLVKPNDIFKMLFLQSKQVYTESNGAFDPTVGPLVNAWGFGPTERVNVDSLMVDSIMTFVGFDKVELQEDEIVKKDKRVQFDFNAIAQGYAVDLIGNYLKSKGIDSYLIDIGGEVLASGLKEDEGKWVVGIELPEENSGYGNALSTKIGLTDKALATSGNYRKFYIKDGIKYAHTIDPKTGFPVQHSLLSVTVIADQCSMADAYATTFMVIGLEKAQDFLNDHLELDAFFIYSDKNAEMKYYYTQGFKKIMRK